MTNRLLVLLSGEETTVPAAEARALILAYDPHSTFASPERRVVIAETRADPARVARRIAFARVVGTLLDTPTDSAATVHGKSVRVRSYTLGPRRSETRPADVLDGLDVAVDLDDPDYEFSVVEGERSYIALSEPRLISQGWSTRRPRKRAFFHPSAMFPKLSRAIVNLARCVEGETLLDPFSGTGSILIEASQIGLKALAADQSDAMARGSLANMKAFGQSWLGVVRADAFALPFSSVDGIATDVPYGRASSTRGKGAEVVRLVMEVAPGVMKHGARLVLMHPRSSEALPTVELELEEEHHLYVHKLLTRTISVLRRR